MGYFKISEIMFVDDDAIVRLLGTKILTGLHFDRKISHFENGKLALDYIKKRIDEGMLPDKDRAVMILLDINMPEMDAWEFLDKFQEISFEFKKYFLISIISSSIDSSEMTRAFLYPDVLDFIQKPLSSKHVIDFLNRHHLYSDD